MWWGAGHPLQSPSPAPDKKKREDREAGASGAGGDRGGWSPVARRRWPPRCDGRGVDQEPGKRKRETSGTVYRRLRAASQRSMVAWPGNAAIGHLHVRRVGALAVAGTLAAPAAR
ncbi:hypothetical protein GCM10010278_83090 [Streptomyces melanogenes]|nr:hypothetical protein GCM10010278_83090 [Streptomyces melanogenes]